MILSDREIEDLLAKRAIVIEPPPLPRQYTTSALDLTLGDELYEFRTPQEIQQEIQAAQPRGVRLSVAIDMADPYFAAISQKYLRPVRKEPDGSFLIERHQFVLGSTREYIKLPKEQRIAARVESKSTLARFGLVVHLTAPTVHAGFSGVLVLEICNLGYYPLRLVPGQRICQLIFERLRRVPKGPVRTQYQHQQGVRPP
ncbi:MAG: dCTP deaminase [Chloroflexi bacterium]|nr:dCTP deaminase [Chloroflexota bacterium]